SIRSAFQAALVLALSYSSGLLAQAGLQLSTLKESTRDLGDSSVDDQSLVLIYLEQSQYLSESTNTSSRSSLGQLGLRFKHEEGKRFTKRIDAHGVFSFTETRTPYLAVPELYLASAKQEGLFFDLGRRKR